MILPVRTRTSLQHTFPCGAYGEIPFPGSLGRAMDPIFGSPGSNFSVALVTHGPRAVAVASTGQGSVLQALPSPALPLIPCCVYVMQ